MFTETIYLNKITVFFSSFILFFFLLCSHCVCSLLFIFYVRVVLKVLLLEFRKILIISFRTYIMPKIEFSGKTKNNF
jgi:hypothetical protein